MFALSVQLDVLREARALIADPDRWCQGYEAVDANGVFIDSTAPQAVRWCALGALGRVANRRQLRSTEMLDVDEALDEASRLYGKTVDHVNDEDGHAAVLRVYDAAIADVEAALERERAGAAQEVLA
jgi:hypothetical protein